MSKSKHFTDPEQVKQLVDSMLKRIEDNYKPDFGRLTDEQRRKQEQELDNELRHRLWREK